jgi:CPA2 family monovalent cation:H+ antiporter-2
MWLGSRVVVGPALHFVARTRSPEVFVVTIMTLVLAAAWGAAQVGLSIAIGTFCAGLLFSESEYAHQILADVLPFRDVFQTLFFVSVGMLLDPRWVAAHPGPVAAAVVAVIAGKMLLAALAARLGGAPARVAVAIGVALAQIGEFSFVLLTLGRSAGALSEEVYQLTLAASVGSMAVAPPLIANVRGVLDALARLPLVGRAIAGGAEADLGRAARDKRDHVVIVGFGPVGRDVAQFLLDHGIDFVVIELNPGTVREFRERGIDIYFGDATNRTVLAEAAVDRARALVVAIPDPATAKRTVRAARALNAKLPIVARTKYRADADAFARLGAGEVVEEEFETAREMVLRLACAVGIPRRLAIERMAGQRLERYRVGPPRERYRAEGWPFPPIEIEVARVARKSPLAGKSIGEAAVRSRTGATIVAIVREAGTILYPGPDARIEAHDRIACLGTPEELESVRKLAGSD